MKHYSTYFFLVIFLVSCFYSISLAQTTPVQTSSPDYWLEIGLTSETPTIQPSKYRVLGVEIEALRALLFSAPNEKEVSARQSSAIISLPMPDGSFQSFSFVNAPIMAPELASRFPEIQVYLGQGVDSPSSIVRFDLTPQGFHAMILSAGETIYIDPFNPGDLHRCISYTKSSFYKTTGKKMEDCVVDLAAVSSSSTTVPKSTQEGVQVLQMGMQKSNVVTSNGSTLRMYRLALACTGEYTSYHGGTTSGALSAMNTTMARVNGVFERDVCLRMVLVSNNDDIIFLNSGSDPYTNSSGSAMLSENQSTCNSYIGSSNYDIGHVFSTGGGGIASLQSPCTSNYKARGVTGRYSPVGDPFDIDYVAHEIGHQWGANHTQNNSCNRASSAAYEPGSASTIMGYAGICSPNLQNNSDDHFHNKSINEMISFTVYGSGNNCDTPSSTGNSIPTVEAGSSGFTIPADTPFELEAIANDVNGDAITYNWEQYDLGPQTANNDNHLTNPSGNQPIFRSWSSSTSATRVFPRISDLVSNGSTIGELLPTYSRDLQFKCSVRDNVAGGGAFRDDVMSFHVDAGSGPFVITAPQGGSLVGNEYATFNWSVAGTDSSPVSCSSVEILMSTDGGYTYPTVLTISTANDGSASVLIPNINSNTVRFKIKSVGNIFFDISNYNTSITISNVGVEGCTDETSCNYNPEATDDDGTCMYPPNSIYDCDGVCNNDSDSDGVCDEDEIAGCIAPSACNYNPLATDPSECVYPEEGFDCDGPLCTNDLNENGYIDVEDLLLILSEFGCLSSCNYDVTGDGQVSVGDILTILSNFGVACD